MHLTYITITVAVALATQGLAAPLPASYEIQNLVARTGKEDMTGTNPALDYSESNLSVNEEPKNTNSDNAQQPKAVIGRKPNVLPSKAINGGKAGARQPTAVQKAKANGRRAGFPRAVTANTKPKVVKKGKPAPKHAKHIGKGLRSGKANTRPSNGRRAGYPRAVTANTKPKVVKKGKPAPKHAKHIGKGLRSGKTNTRPSKPVQKPTSNGLRAKSSEPNAKPSKVASKGKPKVKHAKVVGKLVNVAKKGKGKRSLIEDLETRDFEIDQLE